MTVPPQRKSADQSVAGAANSAPSPHAPELEWLSDGVPRASAFEDTYFSRAGGLAETRHVFLAGNGLPGRWQDADLFTIAELGFGTGLNLLTTLNALKTDLAPPRKLRFISFELYPLSHAQLAQAHEAFPALETEAAALRAAWNPVPGWTILHVAGAEIWLGIGDARTLIGTLDQQEGFAPVDAWYLDGFSPSKNPQLWEQGLLQAVFDQTAPGGTLATYSAAGWVRRNLQTAGFEIEKCKGFAGKREMVRGVRPA